MLCDWVLDEASRLLCMHDVAGGGDGGGGEGGEGGGEGRQADVFLLARGR